MNQNLVKWTVPAVALAAIIGIVYVRSQPSSGDSPEAAVRAVSRTPTKYPNLWLEAADKQNVIASTADQEHELAGLKDQLKKNPNHTPVLLRMAEVARGLGKTSESMDYLTQAIAGDPGNVEARLELGRELFEAGKVDKAIEVTKQILEKKPGNADALYNLGAIYGNLGQDEIAGQYFQKAVASDPNSSSGQKAKKGLETLSASK
jgi:tetratricopeptide (TPR) repeat protein